jgi:uncharacterized protein YkwD
VIPHLPHPKETAVSRSSSPALPTVSRSRRALAAAGLVAAALSGAAACNPLHPTLPTKPTSGSTAPSAQAAYESRILVLVNAERAKAGLRPLALISCADTYADNWAASMARTGTFAHQSLTPIMKACAARGAGENIAYGNVTADQMMTMWMNSPGHRANILNGAFTHIGIGAVKTSSGRWYGVQDFITK